MLKYVQATCEHSVQTVLGGKTTPRTFLSKNSFSSMKNLGFEAKEPPGR